MAYLANELDLVTLDVLDRKYSQLGEEVETEIVDGVAENGFLYKENIAFGFFDFLDHVQEISSFFLENLVHLAVVVDDDLVFHLTGKGLVSIDSEIRL